MNHLRSRLRPDLFVLLGDLNSTGAPGTPLASALGTHGSLSTWHRLSPPATPTNCTTGHGILRATAIHHIFAAGPIASHTHHVLPCHTSHARSSPSSTPAPGAPPSSPPTSRSTPAPLPPPHQKSSASPSSPSSLSSESPTRLGQPSTGRTRLPATAKPAPFSSSAPSSTLHAFGLSALRGCWAPRRPVGRCGGG